MSSTDDPNQACASGVDELARGFDGFLDGVLRPDVQRILILDGPTVLGLARFTDPVETRHAVARSMRALLSGFLP